MSHTQDIHSILLTHAVLAVYNILFYTVYDTVYCTVHIIKVHI